MSCKIVWWDGVEFSNLSLSLHPRVCTGEMKPEGFIDALRNHPEHMVDVKEEL